MELLRNKTISFIKVEIVFIISLFIVMGTSVFARPKLSYIDFKVLMLLFSLMVVIRAFEELKLLDKIAITILSKYKVLRMVSLTLTFLCFISSMFITNDVALITFVPLTLIIAKKAKFNPIKTIILETLAANIGSSLTPMGNPQNLYLFSFYTISVIDFTKVTIVLVSIGGLWLLLLNYRIPNLDLDFDLDEIVIKDKRNVIIFCSLFIFILFSVFNLIDYRMAFAATLAISLIVEKKLLKK